MLDQEESNIKHRLNQFKVIVEDFFPESVKRINTTHREVKRNKFIATVKAITNSIIKDATKQELDSQETSLTPKASIESSTYYKGKGSYIITFTNNGNTPAEDLSVDFEDVDGIILMLDRNLFPIEVLKPGRSFQIHAAMTEGAPHKMMSYVKWKENNSQNEDKVLVLFNR